MDRWIHPGILIAYEGKNVREKRARGSEGFSPGKRSRRMRYCKVTAILPTLPFDNEPYHIRRLRRPERSEPAGLGVPFPRKEGPSEDPTAEVTVILPTLPLDN